MEITTEIRKQVERDFIVKLKREIISLAKEIPEFKEDHLSIFVVDLDDLEGAIRKIRCDQLRAL